MLQSGCHSSKYSEWVSPLHLFASWPRDWKKKYLFLWCHWSVTLHFIFSSLYCLPQGMALILFNSCVLCICRWEAFKTRCIIAALDHNMHLERAICVDAHGNPRYHRKWSPRSKRWYVSIKRKEKTYAHIPVVMASLLKFYLSDGHSIRKKSDLAPDHPCLIAPTIASEQPPPTATVALDQISRRFQNTT